MVVALFLTSPACPSFLISVSLEWLVTESSGIRYQIWNFRICCLKVWEWLPFSLPLLKRLFIPGWRSSSCSRETEQFARKAQRFLGRTRILVYFLSSACVCVESKEEFSLCIPDLTLGSEGKSEHNLGHQGPRSCFMWTPTRRQGQVQVDLNVLQFQFLLFRWRGLSSNLPKRAPCSAKSLCWVTVWFKWNT